MQNKNKGALYNIVASQDQNANRMIDTTIPFKSNQSRKKDQTKWHVQSDLKIHKYPCCIVNLMKQRKSSKRSKVNPHLRLNMLHYSF